MKNKNNDILKNVASKIMENMNNYTDEARVEINNELIDYLNQNSGIRKIIHFYMGILRYDQHIKNDSAMISSEINLSKLKNECELKEKLVEALNKLINAENIFITSHLINYAKKNGLIKDMGKNTIKKTLENLIEDPRVSIIVDKRLKSMITDNEYYKKMGFLINKDNICFLDGLKNSIIQIDFTEGSFDVFETSHFFNSVNDSGKHFFVMHSPEEISFKANSDNFISLIKLNQNI